MKKLLSLILCLMLCLPALAMAETAAEPALELFTVDFGTFTMGLGENDQYQVAESLASNTLYAIVYINPDPTALTQDSINVVWTTDDVAMEITLVGGIEKYGELVLQNASTQYTSMGIKMTNASVVISEFDGTTGYIITSCTMDYTGAGVDLVCPLYQMQAFFCDVQGGHYIFTLTSSSYETLASMTAYLDTVAFK